MTAALYLIAGALWAMQSNHVGNPTLCVILSIACIFLGGYYLIIGAP